MSLRPSVDRRRIEQFLRELGRAFRGPARLYLVGGTTVVFEGLRGATLGVDLAVEVDPAHHGELMRQVALLEDRLPINIEEASPADFIPLPSGWAERSRFIGRFGQIDVFHFDILSTVMSKLARGHEQDLADVRAIVAAGFVTCDDIEQAWREIEPRLPERGWSAAEIAEYASTVGELLRSLSGTPD